MADWRDEIEKAREDAARAREEAERLRQETRELERRLRHEDRGRRREERQAEREERHRGQGPHGPGWKPPGLPDLPSPPGFGPEAVEGARSEQTFSLVGVNEVHIDQTAGRVTVRPCQGDEMPGVVSSGSKSPPQLEVQRRDDRLVIEVKLSTGWLFRRKQGATTVVRLDASVLHLRIDLGFGEVHLRDLETETLRLDVGAGTVTTARTAGHLRANVGAGKMAIHGHAGLADCDTGTGDLLLDIARIVPGEYKVDAGIGRAEVRLPAGGQVFIKASSGMGKTRIEYPSAPEGAPTTLKINTGVGEVSVKARLADADVPPPPPPVTAKPQRGSRTAPPPRRREAEELRVLQMLEQGRITSQEAADLIAALHGAGSYPEPGEPENGSEGAPIEGANALSSEEQPPPMA